MYKRVIVKDGVSMVCGFQQRANDKLGVARNIYEIESALDQGADFMTPIRGYGKMPTLFAVIENCAVHSHNCETIYRYATADQINQVYTLPNGDISTPLIHAVSKDRTYATSLLLNAEADPNLDNGIITPLELAIANSFDRIAVLLINAGAKDQTNCAKVIVRKHYPALGAIFDFFIDIFQWTDDRDNCPHQQAGLGETILLSGNNGTISPELAQIGDTTE